MKIIGNTADGYLIEATGREIANAAGYSSMTAMPGHKFKDSYGRDVYLPIGLVVEPTKAHAYIHNLKMAEERVRQSEAHLRALADLLKSALPATEIATEEI
ncbi:MAG: hypothetical protein WDN46_10115 [Methylocella sp.]